MIAFLSDIHLGVKLQNVDFLKSLDKFFELIKKHKEECTDIFICGDLFDHKLSIEEHQFASVFILNLVYNGCGHDNTNVPVHFIHGTYNHDNEQYKIYLPFLKKMDHVCVTYAEQGCVQVLKDGRSVLYLPQEYGDVDYSILINENVHYDIIVGHGPMSSSNKNPCKSAGYEITHSADLLGKISNICVFGHYHGYTDFGNNVYYQGAMLKWRYGEPEPCVFMFCDNDYTVTTHLNPFQKEFKTIEINDPESLRDMIQPGIETPHRFVITPTSKEELDTYKAIIDLNKKNTNIKFIVVEQEEDKINDVVATDDTTKSISSVVEPIPSLITYIKDKYDMDVTDEIKAYESKITKE